VQGDLVPRDAAEPQPERAAGGVVAPRRPGGGEEGLLDDVGDVGRARPAGARDRLPDRLGVGVVERPPGLRQALPETPGDLVFLGELLTACADAVREEAGGSPEPGTARAISPQGLERACGAIETANRALVAYSPPEAVLLSLFFAFGGLPHGR
jgi:hypothetical protein